MVYTDFFHPVVIIVDFFKDIRELGGGAVDILFTVYCFGTNRVNFKCS